MQAIEAMRDHFDDVSVHEELGKSLINIPDNCLRKWKDGKRLIQMKRLAEGGKTTDTLALAVDRAWLTDKIFTRVEAAYQCGEDLKPKSKQGPLQDFPSNEVILPSTEAIPFGTGWARTGHPVEYEDKDAQNRQLPPSLYGALPGMCLCSACSVRNALLT